MPQQLTSIEFSLDDTVGGQPLTPENVDLPTLRGFIEEVDEAALRRLWNRGSEAWREVCSATTWVDSLRGS